MVYVHVSLSGLVLPTAITVKSCVGNRNPALWRRKMRSEWKSRKGVRVDPSLQSSNTKLGCSDTWNRREFFGGILMEFPTFFRTWSLVPACGLFAFLAFPLPYSLLCSLLESWLWRFPFRQLQFSSNLKVPNVTLRWELKRASATSCEYHSHKLVYSIQKRNKVLNRKYRSTKTRVVLVAFPDSVG